MMGSTRLLAKGFLCRAAGLDTGLPRPTRPLLASRILRSAVQPGDICRSNAVPTKREQTLAIGGLVTLGGDRLVALVFAEFEAQYRALFHQQAQAVVAADAGGELGANVFGIVTHLRRVPGLDAEVVDQLVTLHAIADVEDVGVDGAGRADAAFARDLVQLLAQL